MKNPEFLINTSKYPGIPVGRLFIPNSHLNQPKFAHWRESVKVLDTTTYPNSEVIWFVADTFEYRRLASCYPHPRHFAYTEYLLKSASTFFSSLKPPYLPDYEYFN
ncbi:hypothetical protein WA1_38840 [Scytonema hofmannii PCC 7110]|uniref:Uncharacterized protein n=1 Tax=Scytonema hofmannii PCC 7110 TaxID=128403 RepID=A0A139X0Z3_9CYAN|nr:hypothetical protein [Scytonema hofmannii]KYC38292.1 hypothetical protein WA1_38840 [Scytonema hofmannii PCC 7110]